MNKVIEKLTKDVAFWDNFDGRIAQIPRDDYDQALAILRTAPEQPPAGELMKEAIELSKMCISEIVAKYESSHNAIAVLKRKLLEACARLEAPEQPPAGDFTKKLRQKLSDSCCAIIEDLPGWRSMVAEARVMSFEACYRLDRSKASRKDLLTACEAQHQAIDRLFAILIEKDMGFFPSKSGQPWEAIQQGNAAIAKAKKEGGE